MAKSKGWVVLVYIICWWYCGFSQPVLGQPVLGKLQAITPIRQAVIDTANSQLGVREATGKNDGKAIETYLKTTGLKSGYAWCSAFVVWVFTVNKITIPKSAYSPDLFKTSVVYKRNTPTIGSFIFKPSQVFGLYYESKKRVAHVGIITTATTLHYHTIEGNTNTEGSREGDGVYKRIRKKTTIYVISDFIND